MTKEDILKHQITAQYKNVSTFCEKTGIPESTVRNIFKRGFDGVGVRTAIKICHALSLDIDALMDGKFMLRPNDQKESVLNMYRRHPIDLDKVTEEDLALLEAIQRLPEEQKPLLLSLLQGNGEPPR